MQYHIHIYKQDSGAITRNEMQQCLYFANKIIFQSRHRHISLTVGKVNEIVIETPEAWVKLFVDKSSFFTSLDTPPKSDIPDIPVDAKGKGILGEDPQVLEQKITEDIPPTVTHVQDVEINKPLDNIEENFPPTIEIHEVEAVGIASPSGKATGAEENVKNKAKQKEEEKGRVEPTEVRVPAPSPAIGPSWLALDSSSQEDFGHFEKER